MYKCTPLSDVIHADNHESIEILLDRGADVSCVTPLWSGTFLHFVAENADARAMHILARAWLQGLDLNEICWGFTAADWFWEFPRQGGYDVIGGDIVSGFQHLLQSVDPLA